MVHLRRDKVRPCSQAGRVHFPTYADEVNDVGICSDGHVLKNRELRDQGIPVLDVSIIMSAFGGYPGFERKCGGRIRGGLIYVARKAAANNPKTYLG